mgnify:CR=1 FL=1
MKKTIALFTSVGVIVGMLPGCADMSETQRDTATGADIGAAAGAIIGRTTAGGSK